MPLKRAAIIGYMEAKDRPFYSNDVILLYSVMFHLSQDGSTILTAPNTDKVIGCKTAFHLKLINDICTEYER